MWLLLITLHAAAGLGSFASGIYILSPRRAKRHVGFLYFYLAALVGLLIFMVSATASHWQEISQAEKVIFPGLAVLAIYMLYRGQHAYRLLRHQSVNTSVYMSDIGFTLISLFNGFVIVLAIDLKAPVWVVIAGAIIAALIGSQLVERAKTRFLGALQCLRANPGKGFAKP